MKELIEELKTKIDVDLLGIVKADCMSKIKTHLEDSMHLGYSTEFENNNIYSRIEPKFHLDNPKSIFVIGMSYYWDIEETGKYKISNHARGTDYHKVLGKKLDLLKEELGKIYKFRSYSQVDSGDLYEKELGRKAGFGYIGKNSLLINEDFGSYILLGILVTDIEFEEYSKEFFGSCGECESCKFACPSGSIKGNYKVDSSICHSYLTQWKREVPESSNMNYAYGCDICQRICPKNQGIKKNLHTEFKPTILNFDDIDIENMSNREFKRKFGEYSFSWIGRNKVARNKKKIDNRG